MCIDARRRRAVAPSGERNRNTAGLLAISGTLALRRHDFDRSFMATLQDIGKRSAVSFQFVVHGFCWHVGKQADG
jgi:hypothetical protein